MPRRKTTQNQDKPETLATEENWSYEAKVAEIEEIISRIETGELDLADVFEQFSIAINYLQECDRFLHSHQQQIDLLIETLNPES